MGFEIWPEFGIWVCPWQIQNPMSFANKYTTGRVVSYSKLLIVLQSYLYKNSNFITLRSGKPNPGNSSTLNAKYNPRYFLLFCFKYVTPSSQSSRQEFLTLCNPLLYRLFGCVHLKKIIWAYYLVFWTGQERNSFWCSTHKHGLKIIFLCKKFVWTVP